MIKVLSIPHVDQLGDGESGIHSVVRNYFKLAPDYDIEFVEPKSSSFDVLAIHAGTAGSYPAGGRMVAHLHGLYFTGDYDMPAWAYRANKAVIESARHASIITVPSDWVGDIIKRDMRLAPEVLPHGIDMNAWQNGGKELGSYVIGYAKNRTGVDVCDSSFIPAFARKFNRVRFVCTFAGTNPPDNVQEIGVIPHDQMRNLVQGARVFINTTKETFGIAMLEAMASGVPVLAFNHGGAASLVKHGVTGYLARPGDYEDLANGLDYCYRYAETLGANAILAASHYSWGGVMAQLSDIYHRASVTEPASVGIVIPVYNKPAEQLIRAIDSAMEQTYEDVEIVVVDDGSNSGVDYKAIAEERGAKFVRQENGGVANARNRGIKELPTKYILCLDADDAIDPRFIKACVDELEADNSLGIAYTGLQWIKPDGSTGLSEWPGKFDYDKFVKGQNQVPTACVFRKEAWRRTGGYQSRYCPNGAGEEDTNFWLRIGSIGYGAKKVTDAGLFIYSWMSGAVSGDSQHKVTDWRIALPWTRDGIHPIASVATPKRSSHPIYQRDEPVVSVVIPVGEGHEDILHNALDSVESQTFRDWEVVVAWDSNSEPDETFLDAYPYIRLVNTGCSMGAGFARNRGVETARAPFLLFLDADDQLHYEAIEKMLIEHGRTGNAIYTDYVGRAIVEDVNLLADDLKQNVVARNEETGVTDIIHRLRDFDQTYAMRQPSNPPYIWCNITTLFPKVWHTEVGGFDEDMESWEDVEYWYKMAWAGKEFTRISEPLMLYSFISGKRRQTGLHNWDYLLKYLENKRGENYGM